MGGDLSADGKTLLLGEGGVAGGRTYGAYLRKTDGSPAVRIGDGTGVSLSPDGKWAMSGLPTSPQQMVLLPTGPGESRVLPRHTISSYTAGACWFADGRRTLFSATEPSHRSRIYMQDVSGGAPPHFRRRSDSGGQPGALSR